jgi:phenylalanyl-tRNA synthetase alpha chain
MEIFSYHKGLNKLIEIGNSGIFRPEMLEVCVFERKSTEQEPKD